MKKIAIVGALALATTACGSTTSSARDAAAPSTSPLTATVSGAPSGPTPAQIARWRQNAARNVRPYVAALTSINPGLADAERAQRRGVTVCEAIQEFRARNLQTRPGESARLRYEGGDSGPLNARDGVKIAGATIRYVCPDQDSPDPL